VIFEPFNSKQSREGGKMPWTTLKISSAPAAQGQAQALLNQFTSEWTRLLQPRDMALFFLQEPGADFASYYLSPGTKRRAPEIVRTLGAKPGVEPSQDAVLAVGHQGTRVNHL
jgi:hypothetical protein